MSSGHVPWSPTERHHLFARLVPYRSQHTIERQRAAGLRGFARRRSSGDLMTATKHDLVGIGNAIVDIIGRCDDEFLIRHGAPKGNMRLIDADTVSTLYAAMGPAAEISGGSVANTMVVVASLGGRAAFIGKVALSLSDAFCVDRHRSEFLDLVRYKIDILIANEREITSLYQTADFDEAARRAQADTRIAALTRGEKGSTIYAAGRAPIPVAAAPVPAVIDTTGAGDLYAAGLLFGIATGRSLETAGRLGSLAASEAIGHLGARPQQSLAELARSRGLI